MARTIQTITAATEFFAYYKDADLAFRKVPVLFWAFVVDDAVPAPQERIHGVTEVDSNGVVTYADQDRAFEGYGFRSERAPSDRRSRLAPVSP